MKYKNKAYINKCIAGLVLAGLASPVVLADVKRIKADVWNIKTDSRMGISGEGREVFTFNTTDEQVLQAVNFNGLAYIGDVIIGETAKLKEHGLHFATPEDNEQAVKGVRVESAAIIHYESTWTGKAWPNATIPYSVNGVTGEALDNFNAAIEYWNNETNIQFVPRTTQSNYLNVTTGTWCSSWIGQQGGGQQVTMHPGCGLSGAVHELGHAVGLHHEQVRHDRDDYVDIIWDNIPQGNRFNFDKYGVSHGRDYGEYDYYSVMHYFATAFGSGTITIQPKDPSIDLSVMGYSAVLSATDKAAVQDLYFNAPPPGNVAPESDFSWNVDGLTVSYTDNSIDDRGVMYWQWDLGDGNFSNEQNPVHTYASNPGYGLTVRLTATDESGLSHQKSYVVNLGVDGEGGPPDAEFSYTTNGLTANFTDTSGGSPGTYWQWNFGDGQYGYVANPSHTYANAGTYTVELRVNNAQGLTDTYTDTVTVSGGGNEAPIAGFTHTKNNLAVSFTDASTDDNGVTSRTWNFGDGSTSTQTNPSHTYAVEGTYTVTLTATDADGLSDTQTSTISVSSGNTNTAPTANFSFTTSNLTASFTDSSTDDNGVTSRSWNFGDGNSATSTNPSHLYSATGSYIVSLTVNDAQGLSNTKTSTVTVTNTPTGSRDGSCTAAKAYLIENGQTSNIAVAAKASKCYLLRLPANVTSYTVSTSGNNGDMDLYTKKGSIATTSSYDCSSTGSNSNESCTRNATSGDLFIRAYAWSASNNITVSASYVLSTGGGGGQVVNKTATGTISNSNTDDYVTFTAVAGNIQGTLSGPSGTDFELDLQKKVGSSWTTVSSSTLPTSAESINYNAGAAQYRFKVYRYSGTGAYSLSYSYTN